LTGHASVQRHLSLMGLINDPFCSYCDDEIESASHFALLLQLLCNDKNSTMWGKQVYTPLTLTVQQ